MKKGKIAVALFLVLVMLLAIGCSGNSSSTATPTGKCEIVKVTKVKSGDAQWAIYQLHLEIEGGGTFTIDLNLTDGDKVDCWYNTEKPSTGGSVDFQVKAGSSVIYTSTATGSTAGGNTSDRLSFTASQANGASYRLIFRNSLADKNSKETIFTEIIYPAKDSAEDSIFIPLETQ